METILVIIVEFDDLGSQEGATLTNAQSFVLRLIHYLFDFIVFDFRYLFPPQAHVLVFLDLDGGTFFQRRAHLLDFWQVFHQV